MTQHVFPTTREWHRETQAKTLWTKVAISGFEKTNGKNKTGTLTRLTEFTISDHANRVQMIWRNGVRETPTFQHPGPNERHRMIPGEERDGRSAPSGLSSPECAWVRDFQAIRLSYPRVGYLVAPPAPSMKPDTFRALAPGVDATQVDRGRRRKRRKRVCVTRCSASLICRQQVLSQVHATS